jgi:hypothetical protein
VIKAVILDFDGTLAVLNMDFSEVKEEISGILEGAIPARNNR